jgi:hypothetical protein
MTSRRALAQVLALSFSSAVASTVVVANEKTAHAQSEPDLQAARELFQEAYKDEQEKRYEVALEKFRRVAQVKESAQVRYRIASVLDAMNRLREARDAYRACAAMKPSLPPKDQAVADACAEKALSVDKRVPKLVVTVSGENPPADAKVTVDGAPVPTGRPIEQDPGEHTVQASATGMKPYEQKVTLPDNGSQIPATVMFEADKPTGGGGLGGTGGDHDTETGKKGNKTIGYVALGAGGVLMVTGIVLLVVREGAIDDIKTACPNQNACDPKNETLVHDKKSTADLLLPLGVGFTVVGAAAAGFGVYTILKKPSADAPASSPQSGSATSRIEVGPHYVRGGGMLDLRATF